MLKNIFLAFIPIFVAVDAIGVLPLYISFTEGLKEKEKNMILIQSILTATILALFFIILGKSVFKVLGITMGDFMIAGGAILFCISIIDLTTTTKKRRIPGTDIGAVPLGTPLIVGPAVLTTSLLIISQYGLLPTIISIIVNILLAGAIFKSSRFFIKILGNTGSKAFSKIFSLLLAAIAVMLIRKGLLEFISQ